MRLHGITLRAASGLGSSRSSALTSLAAVAAAVLTLSASSCLRLDDQPCPEGGQQCPAGYACVDELCQPITNDGVSVVVHAGLDDAVEASYIRRVVIESYPDGTLGCSFRRDPDDADRFAQMQVSVSAPVTLGEDTPARMPAGRQVVLVRALNAEGEDVARACQVQSWTPRPEPYDLWATLVRTIGICGDGILDFGEQCDHGVSGDSRCSSDCQSRTLTLDENGSACLRDLSIACTDGADDRCLIAWVRDGAQDELVVNVRNLSGSQDTEGDRGLTHSSSEIRHPRLTASGDDAAVVWIDESGQLTKQSFNFVGQRIGTPSIEMNTSNAALTLARYANRDDEVVLLAGYLNSSSGEVLLRDVDTPADYAVTLPGPPASDVVATLFSSSVLAAWTQDGDVVAAWANFDDGQVSEVTVITDNPENAQSDPALAAFDNGRAFFAWTDANEGIEGGDRSGLGVRGRRVGVDGGDPSVTVNSTHSGDQIAPTVVAGHDYVVTAWLDQQSGELRARYMNAAGAPMPQPFGEGLNTDFAVDDGGDQTGEIAMVANDLIFFAWIEDASGCSQGGHRLRLRLLPPPLR